MPHQPTPRPLRGETSGSAVLSRCGRYRYRLTRTWAPGRPAATFIMLNPSTADADRDDATIRRCLDFAARWGCGRLVVVNLFAWRSPRPADLLTAPDPVGPDNDTHLAQAATAGGPLVAAWGAHRLAPARAQHLVRMPGMQRLTALAVTRSGQPRHPLYLPGHLTPTPIAAAVREAQSRRGQ